jgi:hypothetical protein
MAWAFSNEGHYKRVALLLNASWLIVSQAAGCAYQIEIPGKHIRLNYLKKKAKPVGGRLSNQYLPLRKIRKPAKDSGILVVEAWADAIRPGGGVKSSHPGRLGFVPEPEYCLGSSGGDAYAKPLG